MNYLEIDKTSRDKIANVINKNFFVEAGAGSGKTYSLVQRMVAMILNGIDVKKICAITFTKAAANEFYSRFHKALVEKSSEDLPAQKKALIENAIKDIDLCFMGTIDAFCNMILSEHPMAAGVPSNSSVVSDDEMEQLLRREYANIAQGKCSTELTEKYKEFVKYNSFYAESNFIQGASFILDKRNAKIIYPEPKKISIDKEYGYSKKALLDLLDLVGSAGLIRVKGGNNPTAFIDAFKECEKDFYILRQSWDKNPVGVLRLLKSISKIELDKSLSQDILDKYGEFISVKLTPAGKVSCYYVSLGDENELYNEIENIKYSATMEFICSAVESIVNTLRSEGKLTYFDYLLYLRDMLKKDASNGGRLIEHIYNRHSYFLIDEFQDTNPMQAEVFFYLTAKNPVENWRECVPKAGSLFIVGDPKQSIYRFRNADVESYLSVKEMFKGEVGEVLQLSRNFRSTKGICDWFNTTFERLLPQDTKIQSKFASIPSEQNDNPTDTFGGIYAYSVGRYDYDAEHTELCNIINGLVNNPNQKIYNKGKPRQIEFKDFMIITPTKTHMQAYVKALNEAGIPTRIEGAVSFSESLALNETASILSAIANPTDSRAVYSALKSNAFNISDNEIEEYTSKDGKLKIYRSDRIDSCDRIQNALDKLLGIFNSVENNSPITAINKIKDELHIFDVAGAESLECYYYALELIRNAEITNQITSLKDAAEMLSSIAKNETAEERCLSLQKEENRVHIANLHKVKGLEAPIVILVNPNDSSKAPNYRVADTDDGKKCWLFSLNDNNIPIIKTTLYEDELEAESECLDAEKTRLLYVAATRAREALIISESLTSRGKGKSPWSSLFDDNIKYIDALSILENDNEIAEVESISARELYQNAEDNSVFERSTSLEKSFEIKRPSQIKAKAKTQDDDEYKDDTNDEVEKRHHNVNTALLGTLVHRLMELIVSSRNTVDIDSAIAEMLLDYSVSNDDVETILNQVAKSIQDGGYPQQFGVDNDIINLLLSADEVMYEVPFCYKEQKDSGFELWNGIMDVVYKKDNAWHIVDYKTNAEIKDLDIKYEEQLNAYIKALKTITGLDADAKIYHIDI